MTGIEAMKLEEQIEGKYGSFYTYCLVREDLAQGVSEEFPYLIHALQNARPGDYVLGCLSSEDANNATGYRLWTWEK